MHQGIEASPSNPKGFVKNAAACAKRQVHGHMCEYDAVPAIPTAADAGV
jgi:hypothetical protein